MDVPRTEPLPLVLRTWTRFWVLFDWLQTRPVVIGLLLLGVLLGGAGLLQFEAVYGARAAADLPPRYDEGGALYLPKDFYSWVFVGASTGLSYSDNGSRREGPGMFHNVYLHPGAYQHFAQTGKFPEKTVLALAMYEPSQKGDLVRGGFFEGDLVALELAVKDSKRFRDGWAYFNFSSGGTLLEKARPVPGHGCVSCHAEHGAVDHVFVQFYPVLRQFEGRRAATIGK